MEQIFRLKLSPELKSNTFHLSVDLIFRFKIHTLQYRYGTFTEETSSNLPRYFRYRIHGKSISWSWWRILRGLRILSTFSVSFGMSFPFKTTQCKVITVLVRVRSIIYDGRKCTRMVSTRYCIATLISNTLTLSLPEPPYPNNFSRKAQNQFF